ncbi:MAG: dihydroneopterin aldolase [Oscillospiraceae bacterium]|nr:dihydroneopterin aldolase [Oscillospiraceae bacterium]MDD3833190.1 dihydroneopterin aldolase [Oscillospiraceae bacterium]MDD4546269.1 dihydroneopterin aldolase [Oscillospiraceae bacterium]
MDKIIIKGLRIFAYHGVNPEEKENGQMFELDVTLATDLSKPGVSDNLGDTANYAKVIKLITATFQLEKNDLIERAAQRVADAILENHPVMSVTLLLKKPQAPMKADFDYVAVEITRGRDQIT